MPKDVALYESRFYTECCNNYLSVGDNADDFAVTEHLAEVIFNALLAQIIAPLLAGLGESLLLGFVPGYNQ